MLHAGGHSAEGRAGRIVNNEQTGNIGVGPLSSSVQDHENQPGLWFSGRSSLEYGEGMIG